MSSTTAGELQERVLLELGLSGESVTLKILHKGRVIGGQSGPDEVAFPGAVVAKGKPVKIVAMVSDHSEVRDLNSGRSDPLLRGFEEEKKREQQQEKASYWGPNSGQDRHFKFVRFEECSRQSFGHRAGSKTPHAFRAAEVLERLATDPGIVAIMKERELVVNTLGEMDPIDDRLMQKKAEEGACLLGYNTNHGLRIDVKLRTDDLEGFLPYESLAATVIHELSHNWVGDHNALFWTNYGQMRAEYFHRHATLASSGYYVNGRTTADLAGVADICCDGMTSIAKYVLAEVKQEAAQHGVPLELVGPAVLQRCRELTSQSAGTENGRKLGGDASGEGGARDMRDTRGLALAAAERRMKEEKEKQRKKS
eukprot:CAMPEP_0183294698 /NCGR_PEP_ID=MMETSP0160_2-20130417/2928_1 /TAXON_ID=2839 ORGANISM="Odontella Sinensis, Strain Grunow 1884" /NCGR_SAMPLE_ID=MMETSP0160_2 /ASSEMBLY_ACC=CAM_ASM_000250 /LENGTH=366 /DNA_ID=CAMNT_0025456057 /DNA_START=191 /DNA_END=1291 /DNA_ORIENTATION=+